jgi:hypothetical protein
MFGYPLAPVELRVYWLRLMVTDWGKNWGKATPSGAWHNGHLCEGGITNATPNLTAIVGADRGSMGFVERHFHLNVEVEPVRSARTLHLELLPGWPACRRGRPRRYGVRWFERSR